MEHRTAFITGASSGIGRALALQLAKQGVTVALSARRAELLDQLRREIETAGGSARSYPLDVADPRAVRATLERADDELGGIDLVVANAGLANNRRAQKFRWDECEEMLQVNVIGASATLTALLPRMLERGCGHLVGVSSLAGARALPGMSAYAATKAYLSRFLEGLRLDLGDGPVSVTDVRPGFVESEMTEHFKKKGQAMPFLVGADEAAEIIARGIAARERVIAFPWQLETLMRSVALLPEPLWARGVRKIM